MTRTIHTLPTGYLFADQYSNGMLETLSIGDYGKAANVKADFLGYHRGINGVPNMPCMPLSEKWVVTLSTQYGCPMRCTFCDVPKVRFGGNATLNDLWQQLKAAIELFPEVHYTERLNIHFARMGEPTYNPAVLQFSGNLKALKWRIQNELGLRVETLHPVLTTSLPRANKDLSRVLAAWCAIKNGTYLGQAGLQVSINSTDESQRQAMFSGQSWTLRQFSEFSKTLPPAMGRKYCLNFAYASDFVIDAPKLLGMFDPENWMVKITPIHNNTACTENGIATEGGYTSFAAYSDVERALVDCGFDVLVFVPSLDEEHGLVTCGNVILGGGKVTARADVPNILGLSGKTEVPR